MRLSPLLLLFLSNLSTPSLANRRDPKVFWDETENQGTYVHYPEEMNAVLEVSFQTLMRSPELYVFNVIPESTEVRIWPEIKGMTLRNHLDNKILWSIPNYLIIDGLEYGCRQMVDGVEEHMPVENALCLDHCLNQGRYCAPFHPSSMPESLPEGFQGREIVKEALRRVCFDHYYHGSDIKYFEYMEGFEKANCLHHPDVTQCALQVMAGVDHADYSNLVECVDEENWENDVVNERLEAQLKDAIKYGARPNNMPMLHIGDDLYQGDFSTTHIFQAWCRTFASRPMQPVSCLACLPCRNTRGCLWTLECDGVPFDSQAFLKNYSSLYLPETQPPIPDNNELGELEVAQEKPDASTLPPMAGIPNSDPDNNGIEKAYEAKEIEEDKKAIKLFGLTLFVCLAIVLLLVVFREKRSKQLMKEAYEDSQNVQYQDEEMYSDCVDRNGESDCDFELSPSRGGVVQRHTGSLPPNNSFLPEIS